jgi:hypothetical protein
VRKTAGRSSNLFIKSFINLSSLAFYLVFSTNFFAQWLRAYHSKSSTENAWNCRNKKHKAQSGILIPKHFTSCGFVRQQEYLKGYSHEMFAKFCEILFRENFRFLKSFHESFRENFRILWGGCSRCKTGSPDFQEFATARPQICIRAEIFLRHPTGT